MEEVVKEKLTMIIGLTIVFLLILFIVIGIVHDANRPKHKVYIEYIIYRGDTEYKKTGIYDVKGEDFKSVCYTQKSKYGNGANVLEIRDGHSWFGYIGNQCVCVYSGYNDVECVKLEVVE